MDRLFSLLRHFGLPAMLLLILLEYACFPVSSEIILPFCGALASNQNISFPLLVLLSGFAGLIGTSICYTIGYFGGTPLLTRLGKRFPSLHKGIEGSFQKFRRYGKLLVLFGRFIPLCRTYLGFAAGAMRQPLRIFLPLGLGFFLKENWSIVTSWYARYKNLLIPALLLLLLFIVTKNRTKELA